MYFYLSSVRVEILESLIRRSIDELSADILKRVSSPYLSPYDLKKLERLEDRQQLLVTMYHEIKMFKQF